MGVPPFPRQHILVAIQPQHRALLGVEQAQGGAMDLQPQQRTQGGAAQQRLQPFPNGTERDTGHALRPPAGQRQDIRRLGLPQVAQHQPLRTLLLLLPKQQPVAIEHQFRPFQKGDQQPPFRLALHGKALRQGIGDLHRRRAGRWVVVGGKGRHGRVPIES
jgi:hypothetical protein